MALDNETQQRLNLAVKNGMDPKSAQIAALLYQQQKTAQQAQQPKKFKLSDLLPVGGSILGGIAGGALAGPAGAIAGSGIGGGLGETARQSFDGQKGVDVGSIAKEALYGTLGGAGSELIGAGVKLGGNLLSKAVGGAAAKAANASLKASPSAFAKAAEQGLDLNKTYLKYASQLGNNYDEALGAVAKGGGKGNIGSLIDDAESLIQGTARTAGKTVKISGNDIIKGLRAELKGMQGELGAGTKAKALKAILSEAEQKYSKGVTVSKALQILRSANKEFGRSILDDTGDAVARSAQKLEANTLRTSLKKMFPQIADALDSQSELITLREVLKGARSKGAVTPFNTNINPTAMLGNVLNQPKVAMRLARGANKLKVPTGSFGTAGRTAAQLVTQTPRLLGSSSQQMPEDTSVNMDSITQQEAPKQTGISKEQIAQLAIADLAANKGKNITNILAIAKLLNPEEKKLTASQQNMVSNISKVDSILSTMEGLYKEIGSPTGRIGGQITKAEAALGVNPKAKVYEDLRQSLTTPLARVLAGESGNLSDTDIRRAQGLLPRITDTAAEFKLKIQILRDLTSQTRNAASGGNQQDDIGQMLSSLGQ